MLRKMWTHFIGRMTDEGGWIPAAIAGGSMLLGGILGNQQSAANTAAANAQSAANTASANNANLQIARENTQFQERMSNTAYQRAMQDMKAAGLNPMLAYQQGGAGTPTGSIANMQAAPVQKPDYQDPLAPAVSGAFDAYNKTSLIKQAGEQLGINQGVLKVQQANSEAEIAMKAAQTAATLNSAAKTQKEIEILNSRAQREKLDGDFYGSEKGKTFYYLQKINEAAGGSLDTMNSAKDLLNPFKLLPKKPTKKRIERWDKDGNVTGHTEEIWKP